MNRHLPFLGIGPIYVSVITLVTIIAVTFRHKGIIQGGNISSFHFLFYFIGIFLIIQGITLWARANFQSKIGENVEKNRLVTTGVYASVRNPIYSAYMLINTGVLLFTCNLYLLILPFLYWLYMTVLLRTIEEKWLRALYGQEYIEYCKKVNRCIPWF